MYALPQHSPLPPFRLRSAHFPSFLNPINPPPTFSSKPTNKTLNSLAIHLPLSKSTSNSSDFDLHTVPDGDGVLDSQLSVSAADSEFEATTSSSEEDGDVDVEIVKLGKNTRRITCKIAINANLETVWSLLTDYERLADFIPGLAVCQLLEKTGNRVKLFQIGQQNLAFGIKFNAKGIVDCYEKNPESIPFGQRRDIEFKMSEGDFQVFQGRWSIEEMENESQEITDTSIEQEFRTTLCYVVDVKPKLWLPVRLVEGRLSREIKLNLLCIREEAQKAVHGKLHTC